MNILQRDIEIYIIRHGGIYLNYRDDIKDSIKNIEQSTKNKRKEFYRPEGGVLRMQKGVLALY